MRHLLALSALVVLATAPTVQPVWANPPPAEVPKGETDPAAKRITGSEHYMPTFGLRASVARGFNVKGVLSVDAGLDIPNDKTRKRAEALRPRIINDLRDAVLGYASLSYVVGEKPDVDMLKARMQKAIDLVLGKGEARVALASVIVFGD
jgi:hypothetical protein